MRRRRQEFFQGKRCRACGATDDLELDHIKASQKTSHRIWSWAKARRERELGKCQVLCRTCHLAKSERAVEGPFCYPASIVPQIRRLRFQKKLTYREIGDRLGISFQHVHAIVHGKIKRARLV